MQNKDCKGILLYLYTTNFHRDDDVTRKDDLTFILANEKASRCVLAFIRCDSDNEALSEERIERFKRWELLVKAYGLGDKVLTIFQLKEAHQMVHRLQKAGNCFLQDPAAQQSYLVQRETGRWPGMMNLSKYIRENFDSDAISLYAVQNAGGDSVFWLRNIISPKTVVLDHSEDIHNDVMTDEPHMWDRLENLGPPLVTKFRIEERFRSWLPTQYELQIPFFDGQLEEPEIKKSKTDNDETEGSKYHAMVLVEMLQVKGKWRLLLQNWWEQMQFVEVSAEYFRSSGAELVWVLEKQRAIPQDCTRSHGKVCRD